MNNCFKTVFLFTTLLVAIGGVACAGEGSGAGLSGKVIAVLGSRLIPYVDTEEIDGEPSVEGAGVEFGA